ncbi:hypothetical protein HOU11_gp23 [Pectobacterium phage Gaspode]|uniref:Uncharacterized protein n=1 Tax=Pectobacterium phage Gaspode TaxID=2320194 RepID=A0A385IFL9_9CAUD|nr:hypothetical protein HOU11_gp23 [Pectobacterium phage Gaspode]AXY81680.1 hypothetical protein [Pectobacterium phage Gaspode]
MTKYIVSVPFCGYMRGYKVYTVEADSPEEAEEKACDWDYITESIEVTRDDSETDWANAEVAHD